MGAHRAQKIGSGDDIHQLVGTAEQYVIRSTAIHGRQRRLDAVFRISPENPLAHDVPDA